MYKVSYFEVYFWSNLKYLRELSEEVPGHAAFYTIFPKISNFEHLTD
jgi:hypothetical protein